MELLSICETEFCATKCIPFCDPDVPTGTILLLKPKTKASMQRKQALFTNQVLEQAAEDTRQGARLVTLQKIIHIVNYIAN